MWASLFRLDGSHLVSIGQMNSATNDCEIKGGRGICYLSGSCVVDHSAISSYSTVYAAYTLNIWYNVIRYMWHYVTINDIMYF